MFHDNEVCVVKPEDPVDPLLLFRYGNGYGNGYGYGK